MDLLFRFLEYFCFLIRCRDGGRKGFEAETNCQINLGQTNLFIFTLILLYVVTEIFHKIILFLRHRCIRQIILINSIFDQNQKLVESTGIGMASVASSQQYIRSLMDSYGHMSDGMHKSLSSRIILSNKSGPEKHSIFIENYQILNHV